MHESDVKKQQQFFQLLQQFRLFIAILLDKQKSGFFFQLLNKQTTFRALFSRNVCYF